MHRILVLAVIAATALMLSATAFSQGGPNPRPSTWVDGELFEGIVTKATFKPTSGNFDELYACSAGTFEGGVPLISESGPGDTDYNGGRWHMNLFVPDGGSCPQVDNVEDLLSSPGTVVDTGMYFECPLLPRRGN